MRLLRVLAIVAGLVIVASLALTSAPATVPLAATPPMGWNSWNHFADKVSDAVVRQQADAMVSSGMRDAGYIYINIDDTWEGKRDAQGFIHPNEKFPDMKALADYVHSKGLRLGIYSSPGPKTCAGFEGSMGHEEQDAQTYAQWGIDFLKYDWCSAIEAGLDMKTAYTKMHDALLKTGRPIVYSLCQYGWNEVWRWAPSVGGNLWRTTGDIEDNYEKMAYIGFGQSGLEKYAGPGHWNDPDMLEVGNGHMKADEYKTHMSLWCLLSAPLLAGNDLTSMSPETQAMLMNRELIAIDQDPAGKQASRFWQEGPLEIWTKRLADGGRAIGFFNRGGSPATMSLKFRDIGLGPSLVRDLWQHKDLGRMREFTGTVPRHGVIVMRIKE